MQNSQKKTHSGEKTWQTSKKNVAKLWKKVTKSEKKRRKTSEKGQKNSQTSEKKDTNLWEKVTN